MGQELELDVAGLPSKIFETEPRKVNRTRSAKLECLLFDDSLKRFPKDFFEAKVLVLIEGAVIRIKSLQYEAANSQTWKNANRPF